MKTRTMRTMAAVWLATTFGLAACGDDAGHKVRLLAADDYEESEKLRLRELQTMKVVVTDANGQTEQEVPLDDWSSYLNSDVHTAMVTRCVEKIDWEPSTGLCADYVKGAATYLCVANTELDIASLPAKPIEIDVLGAKYTIAAQSTPVNAALARVASVTTVVATQAYLQALRWATQTDTSETCPLTFEFRPGVTLAQMIGSGYVDAYETYKEAVNVLVRQSTAAADAQLSSTASLTQGLSWGISATALSRAAAAHALVGGDPGLFGSTTVGGTDWCSVPEPTPGIRAAIEVFREAGADPNDILDTALPLASLLESTSDCGATCTATQQTPAAPNFSVRERLADRWSQELQLLQSTTPTIPEYFGLTMADFQGAREYLASEIKAFSRSKTAVLRPPVKAGGAPTNVPLFAGVATIPPVRPPQYFAALAKPGPIRPVDPLLQLWVDPDLATFVDWALSGASNELAAGTGPTSQVPGASQPALLDPIAALVAESLHERVGRIVLYRLSEEELDVDLLGLGNADEPRVVRGEDGLACAASGTIEGAPCDVDAPGITAFGFNLEAPYPNSPFKRYVTASWSSSPYNPADWAGRFYLVRRVASSAGQKRFEPLVGFEMPAPGVNEGYAIVPLAERRAGELLAPDRNWCSRSHVSCAGVALDARIPLEDELSDDSNGVENSWKHYIDLARRAATDADSLGEAVLDAGTSQLATEIEIAGRAEQAMEQVQQICGADIDIEQLRNILGSNGDLEKLRTNTTCTTDANCDPTPPDGDANVKYHCMNARCVGDLLATVSAAASQHPALQRIAECVAPGTVQDFVTPGSQDLCVWMKNGVPCADIDEPGAGDCPAVASAPAPAGCESLKLPNAPPDTYDVVQVTAKLNYFQYSDGSGGIASREVCDTIRNIRRYGRTHTAFVDLASSEFFHPATFGPFARQIAFEPRFNSHSAVLLGGAPVFLTGDEWAGLSSGWPCAARPNVECSTGDPSLMCALAPNGCASKDDRAPINRRLLDAVTALRGMVSDGAETDSAQTMFPAVLGPSYGEHEAVNKFVRSRASAGLAPVEISEVQFKGDPRTFTFYKVLGSNGTDAWKDLSCDAGGNCSYHDYTVSMAVVPGRPKGLCAKDCIVPFFAGLSSGWAKEPGNFSIYLDSASTNLATKAWLPSTPNGYSGTFAGMSSPGESYLGHGVNAKSTQVSMDALELACEVARTGAEACDLNKPPNVAAEGWPAAKRYLDCAASAITRRGALTLYADFPVKAIDALRKESKVGAFPALGGTYGAAISRLRGALVDVSEVTPLISMELRSLGTDFEHAETSVALTDIAKKKSEVQLDATVMNEVTACLTSAFKTIEPDPKKGGLMFNSGQALAAAATCANTYAQITYAKKIKEYETDEANLLADQARLELRERFDTHATNLRSYGARLTKSSEEIDASLAEIQTLRDEARRSLYRALLDTSTVGKKQSELLAVSKARFGTAQRRYEAARQNAILAAFIAKRAVETRLGVRLSSLKEDLPLVAAPHSWESKVCESAGVNFADVVREGGAKDYADAYIGDYVDKLENVVESYRLVNNFHEGTDTAVVSLKDDFNRVKKDCPTKVNNLLYHAGDFSGAGVYDVSSAVVDHPNLPENKWALAGCILDQPDCVGISALGEDGAPFNPEVTKLSGARGYRVNFGPEGGTCQFPQCGYQAGAYLAQRVELVPGKYRISWHTRQPSVTNSLSGAGIVALSGPAVTAVGSEGAVSVGTQGWFRRWQLFDVSDGGTYAVLIGPSGSSGGSVDLAAVMLENAPGAVDTDKPPTFANTGDTLTRLLPTCADTDGGVFRATKWRRGCVQLCADGYAASCDGAAAKTYCYRETLVSFTQADIDAGAVFGASGIAKGNFNYRIERIGVNFVGTGMRSCETASNPLSCAASAYWTYSLQHGGPYHVRNYTGQDVEVQLFTGNIEHARGLAAERFLTNPMSSADNELMATYMRREFQGRPLDGSFVLRVWEEPDLNFDALEDVQLALEYRYWTRFK